MNDESSPDYSKKITEEKIFFEGNDSYKNLPDINQYWSKKYLRPRLLEVFEIENHTKFYDRPILQKSREAASVRILSLGSGNGKMELTLARRLQGKGQNNISIVGIELSEALVESSNARAREQGLENVLSFTSSDFNCLSLKREWDFVIANQILHHVSNLEGLFTQISLALKPGGLLMTRDVIGRNGHQAWPEALSIVNDIWRDMPERYKYHNRLNKPYEEFPNIDFSRKSFEGVRAQDILPLMLERFSFANFYAYGGITERFLGEALALICQKITRMIAVLSPPCRS